MSLVTTPIEKTPAQKTLDAIDSATMQGINSRVRTYTQLYNSVWKNAYGLTPPQVGALLGANAKTLFALAAQEKATLPAAAAAAGAPLATPLPDVPPTWSVAFDDAGNVTMTPVTATETIAA